MATSTVPMWLDGAEVAGTYSFPVYSPASDRVLHHAAGASLDDAARAAQSCQAAFRQWSNTTPPQRRDILLRAATVFAARKEQCWRALHDETAAPREFFEVTFQQAINMCRDVAGRIQGIIGHQPQSEDQHRQALVVKVPYGVVLGIAPWNAPLVLGLRACIQPIACGNTVVLKGSELAPKTFWIIASVLHEAGLPPGVLNTLYHRREDAAAVTNALIASPLIKKITYTGSTDVGSAIASMAGRHVKPLVLELGGKAPAIVLPDADVEHAARSCALGAFLHAGQICMSTERIIVHKDIEGEFVMKLQNHVKKLFETEGHHQPLISTQSHQRNLNLLRDATSKGAKILSDPDYEIHRPTGPAIRPVILSSVDKSMDVFYKESFGPLVSILVAVSDERCVEMANDTEYGLTAAVFTKDLQRGLRLATQLESGAVHINSTTVHDENSLPHGGVKCSGYGRNNGDEGLGEWVQTKTITWLK